MTSSVAKLEALNAYRATEGKAPYTAWKQARHQPMLDAYDAAVVDPFPGQPIPASTLPAELLAQQPAPETFELTREQVIEKAATLDLSTLGMDGIEGHCPKCGIHLSNGVATYTDICDTNKQAAGEMEFDITCLGCGGEWGPKVVREKSEDRHTGTGLKIEKNREKRNGVTRPSAGGRCAEVWEYLDSVYNDDPQDGKGKVIPTAKMVKEAAVEMGWNPNNASIEFYQWRKFMGISGRAK